MQVGTYADGRVLNYDEVTKGFDIGGLPITPSQVVGYDLAGQVSWQTEDMKSWAYAYAASMDASTPAPPALGLPMNATPQPVAPRPKQGWFRDLPTAGQVLFFIFYPVSIPYGIWATWKKGGRFSQLPGWAKVLFIIFYPVSITYGVWAMWRDNRFSQGARIAITVLAASAFVFLAARVAISPPSTGAPVSVAQSTPVANPAAPATLPLKALALVASAPERAEAASVNIVGSTTPSATVTVGGTPVPVDADGQFKHAVALAPGANSFAVVSALEGYQTETRSLTVTRLKFAALTARAFEVLAKNPDAQIGRTYMIYGEVTQFDAATGTDTFRADIGATKSKIQYKMADYDQNSMLTGDAATLADTVEGDCFQAKVICSGSFSYDTQIGGSTTVPKFEVVSIKRYGSTK